MNRLNYLLTLSALFLFQPLYASSEGDADYAIAASLFLEVLNEGKIELVDDILAEEVLLQGKQMDRQRLKQIFKARLLAITGERFCTTWQERERSTL
jgi:hypothetical protein